MDHADQGPHRHVEHRHPHPGGGEGLRQGPGDAGEGGAGGGGGRAQVAGREQRLRRARGRWLLRGHRAAPRPARALRAHHRHGAGRDRHRARRRDGDDHGRGPGALRRVGTLCARLARRPGAARVRRLRADDERPDPARPGGRGQADAWRPGHPHRERAARGLRVCRHPRGRPRRLRQARAAGGGRGSRLPAGLLRHLERPVREHGARQGEDEDRRAGDAGADLRAALPQLPPAHRDPDRDAVGALRAGGRGVADVVAGLPDERGGGGRIHRARRGGGGDRRDHADLPGPRMEGSLRAQAGRGPRGRHR
ncbi:MAG: hypothetical protein BWZ09_02655 [Alphaproteobacteria bacterium ADurb.BinA305]|nr:MAG: hypothetical protein BWZ09_02655 [Alphaproteobacteria bacterium ADurb.BinA305]